MTWTWVSLNDLSDPTDSDGTYYYAVGHTYNHPDVRAQLVPDDESKMLGPGDGNVTVWTYQYNSGNGWAASEHIFDLGATVTVGSNGTVQIKAKQPYTSGYDSMNWKNGTHAHVSTSSGTLCDPEWVRVEVFPFPPYWGWALSSLGWMGSTGNVANRTFRYVCFDGASEYGDANTQRDGAIDAIRVSDVVSVSGGAFSEARPIGMDVDTQDEPTLWLTVWNGDEKLYLEKLATSDLSLLAEYELGAVAVGELYDDYIAYPRTSPGDKDQVFVYGRMNDPQSLGGVEHVIKTEDGGLTWSSVITDWNSSNMCAALELDRTDDPSEGILTAFANITTTTDMRAYYTDDDGDSWTTGSYTLGHTIDAAWGDPNSSLGGLVGRQDGASAGDSALVWQSVSDGDWTDRTGNLYTLSSATKVRDIVDVPLSSLFSDSVLGPDCPLSACAIEARNRVGGPIDTFSSNYNYQVTDLSIPAVGQSLRFERTYNSLPVTGTAVYSRPLGYGWTHNYDINLTLPGDPGGEADTAILKAPHGSRMRFEDQGDGSYEPYPGVWATMTRQGTSAPYTYVVTAANQTVYTFGVLSDSVAVESSWGTPPTGLTLGPDYSVAAAPGAVFSLTHTLTNTGATTDSYTITVTSAGDWASVEPVTATLAGGVAISVTATITAPGSYGRDATTTAVLTATSWTTPTLAATATETLTLRGYRLLMIQDAQGNQTAFDYDSSDYLGRVSDSASQRYLEFDYDAGGRLTSVTDHTGRSVGYAYGCISVSRGRTLKSTDTAMDQSQGGVGRISRQGHTTASEAHFRRGEGDTIQAKPSGQIVG